MANTREILGDQETLDALIANTLTDFEDDSITLLRSYAFSKKTALRSVSLPAFVQSGQYRSNLFDGCTSLTSVSLPNLIRIHQTMFNNCTSLVSVVFPNVRYLHISAFNGCSSLETIDLANTANIVSVTSNSGEGNPGSLSALKNILVRYAGDGQASLASILVYAAKILTRRGAIFVPDAKVAAYRLSHEGKTVLPISRYPANDDYSTITDSWLEIIAAENNATYLTKYALGDTKKITIDGADYYAVIIAFDKDDKADGTGKAHITWLLASTLSTHRMAATGSTAGGWPATEMRDYLVNTVLPTIDMKDYIVSVEKTYTDYVDSALTTSTCNESIWLLSTREALGADFTGAESTGAEYYTDWFSSNTGLRRGRYDDDGSNSQYYLRSAADSRTYRVVYSGGVTTSTATSAKGVVFGFCT